MILNENLFEEVESRDDVVYYEYDKDRDIYFIYNKKSKAYPLPSNSETSEDDAKKAVEVIKKYYIDEYLQYDNRRDEDEEEVFDDEYLFDEEERGNGLGEQLSKETDPEKKQEIKKEISELEKEAEDCDDHNNPYGATRANQEIDKLEEDMTLPAVSDEEIAKTEESPSEMVEANAYSNAIIDALNDEWATVQKYQEIVNQLSEHEEFKQFIPVIEDIIKDEKNHVGNLQKVLNDINPTTLPDIKDGEEEAEEQMGEKAVENNEENK